MALSALAGVGSILGGLGSLFGKKKKQPTPAQNILSQAQGARQAADQYGFNPLTLLQYGQPGGATPIGGGGTPPLASIGAITEGLKDIGDVVSGDAARRRAADQLELDLAQLKLEQAQSGVIAAAPGAAAPGAAGVGSGPSPLGRSAAVRPTQGGATHSRQFGMQENPIAPGREKDVMELPNSPGVFEIENEFTFNRPVTIAGDGEPWGADEWAAAVPQIVPQLGRNYVLNRRDETEEQRKRRERRRDQSVFRHPPGHLGMISRAMQFFH